MIALIPNSILNTHLAGRVWYIFRNFELNISNTQPELKRTVAYKKKIIREFVSGTAGTALRGNCTVNGNGSCATSIT